MTGPPSPKTIGYARVSTDRQDTDMQRQALLKEGCWQIIDETASGGKRDRRGLKDALAILEPGDTLAVWKLDRLSRSMLDLLNLVEDLEKRKINFVSLTESFDTRTPLGKLHLQVMGAFAEYERAMIRARTMPGLERAHAKGHFGGRRRVLYGAKLQRAKKMWLQRPISEKTGQPVTDQEIAERLGVCRATLYRYVRNGGLPSGKPRRERFMAKNPNVDAWLEATDDPLRGTNPEKRKAS